MSQMAALLCAGLEVGYLGMYQVVCTDLKSRAAVSIYARHQSLGELGPTSSKLISLSRYLLVGLEKGGPSYALSDPKGTTLPSYITFPQDRCAW